MSRKAAVAEVVDVDDGDDVVEFVSGIPSARELSNPLELAQQCLEEVHRVATTLCQHKIPLEDGQKSTISALKQQIDKVVQLIYPESYAASASSASAVHPGATSMMAPSRLMASVHLGSGEEGVGSRPVAKGKRKRPREIDPDDEDDVEDVTRISTGAGAGAGAGVAGSRFAAQGAAGMTSAAGSKSSSGKPSDDSDILACAICAGQASDIIRQDELHTVVSACSGVPPLRDLLLSSFGLVGSSSSSSSSAAASTSSSGTNSSTALRTRQLVYLESCSHFLCNLCITLSAVQCAAAGGSSVLCNAPASSSSSSSSSSSLATRVCGCALRELYVTESLSAVLKCSRGEQGVLQALQAASIAAATKDLTMVKCPACGLTCEKIQGGQGAEGAGSGIVKDEEGRVLDREAAEHMQKYRLRCPGQACGVNFCTGCQAQPYHLGYTCKQKKEHTAAIKCAYCDTAIRNLDAGWAGKQAALLKDAAKARTKKGAGGTASAEQLEREAFLLAICQVKDCRERAKSACGILLPCGHACGGVKGESASEHMCLHPGCASAAANGGDYCTVCYTEGLSAAPCCKLSCGHILHFHCARNVLSKGYPGNRITFGHMDCGQCRATMAHSSLAQDMAVWMELKKKVQGQARDRLAMDLPDAKSRAAEPALRPGGKYHGKEEQYAMDRYAFYPCSKCKEPYFAGARVCGEAEQAAEGGGQAEHRLCSSCRVPPPGIKQCTALDAGGKKHGIRHLDFKCRYCCSPAVFYCFSTTHFCRPCHDEWMAAPGKLPPKPCPLLEGTGDCPLLGKQKHPPNSKEASAEFALGCAECRLKALLTG